jgi:tryptophan halogenase
MKEIVVLGGGTAGWLTALMVRKVYPNYKITVIENSDIGVIGVGEATVSHFITVMSFLDISLKNIIVDCEGSIKNGINFVNWNGIHEPSYYHAFEGENFNAWSACDMFHMQNLMAIKTIADDRPFTGVSINAKLNAEFKVPFIIDDNGQLEQVSGYAVHFNARKFAEYLKGLGKERNIEIVDGFVDNVVSNDNGDIKSLHFKDGKTISADFFFDCSGMARLLIGKHYNQEWVSFSNHLPMSGALPFFIPHNWENIAPETTAHAMKYGWMWKIPVDGRWGCGYVFDTSYINHDQAKQEVEEMFGIEVTVNKEITFDPGGFRNNLVNNCVSIGLAQSFFEPLESTSILTSCINVLEFLQNDGVNNKSTEWRTQYNDNCFRRNLDIVEFVYLHYLTKRDDTPFWREFRSVTVMPDGLREKIDMWSKSVPMTYQTNDNELFHINSWNQVGAGVGMFDKRYARNLANSIDLDNRIGERYHSILNSHESLVDKCITHEDLIKYFRELST